MSDMKQCAHKSCSCNVSEDKKFCSQLCEDSVGVDSIGCDCKHPECSGTLE